MILEDYLTLCTKGSEVTVIDKDYDLEVYFFAKDEDEDEWDKDLHCLASKLEIERIEPNHYVVVNLYDLIERNLNIIEQSDLFYDNDIETIMEDMDSILAGNVSVDWLTKFVYLLR